MFLCSNDLFDVIIIFDLPQMRSLYETCHNFMLLNYFSWKSAGKFYKICSTTSGNARFLYQTYFPPIHLCTKNSILLVFMYINT